MGGGEIGRQLDSTAVRVCGVMELPHRLEDIAEVGESGVEPRLDGNRLLAGDLCVVEFTQILQHHAEIGIGFRQIGMHVQTLPDQPGGSL